MREPDLDTLTRFARETGVNAAWLITGEGPMRPGEEAPAGFLTIPMASGGRRAPISFDEPWLREYLADYGPPSRGNLFAARVDDDAMVPMLNHGDLVIIERGVVSEPGRGSPAGIYMVGDEARQTARIRRVQFPLDGSVVISCDNPAYSAETRTWPSLKEAPLLVGRVILRLSRV